MSAKANNKGIIDVNDLRYFLRIFSKNWYFVLIAIALASVLSWLYSYKLPNVYGASTQILIKSNDVYDYQSQIYQGIGYFSGYGNISNQKRVITSYDLVKETLEKLDFEVSYFIIGRFKTTEIYGGMPFSVSIDLLNKRLYEKPFDLRVISVDQFELSYDKGQGLVTNKYFFDSDYQGDDFFLRVDKTGQINERNLERVTNTDYQFVRHSMSWLVNKYKRSFAVENLDYTSILELSVNDVEQSRPRIFLDSLSVGYIERTLQSDIDVNENTLNYIDRQLGEVTVILNQFEEELENYKENKQILDLNKEESQYFNQLITLDNQIRSLDLDIESLKSLEDYVLGSDDEELLPPAIYILQNDDFLKVSLNDLYAMQMARNNTLFEAKESSDAIRRMDETIQLNRKNLLIYIKNSRAAINDKKEDINVQISDYERLIRGVPRSQRDLLNITRKLEVNERLYMFLLEKRANTVIARAGIIPQTKVIEQARSLGIISPDKVKILYTFVIGGVIFSLIIVFIRVLFYERIENAEQLKELTAVPIMGEVIASEKAEENYIVVDSDPKAAITESFRTIRTNLEYIPSANDSKIVLTTSYRPNEGKTFTSVNLAAILAKAGKKVLLLELDLHKPKVGVGLNMATNMGLSSYLVGKCAVEETIFNTHIENFDVALSGPTPPNASEIVLSSRLVKLFDHARGIYDYILIDTPPVGLISDALILMKHADAVLFVLNTRFANKDHLKNALEVFENNHIPNFGFILNGVRMKKSKYYYNTNYGYGYRYAYGYGYGYGYGRRKKQKEDTQGT